MGKILVLKSMPFIDSTRLYNFGKVVRGFDMLYLPTILFKSPTPSLSGNCRRPLSLSTFLECCNSSVDKDVNFISVVKDSQEVLN
jgi:hypothetical protein